jgi:hypothetical protein
LRQKTADLTAISVLPERVALRSSLDSRLSLKRQSELGNATLAFRGELEFLRDGHEGNADYINVAHNENLRAMLTKAEGDETVLFSALVGKINPSGYYQVNTCNVVALTFASNLCVILIFYKYCACFLLRSRTATLSSRVAPSTISKARASTLRSA